MPCIHNVSMLVPCKVCERIAEEESKTSVRIRVTLDFDFGAFWGDEALTFAEIQARAEAILRERLTGLSGPEPKIVGDITVLLTGGR